MQWLIDNWYVFLVGAMLVFCLFGHRHRGHHSKGSCDEHSGHAGDKPDKGGHGCCH
jgi:hypothetical protein